MIAIRFVIRYLLAIPIRITCPFLCDPIAKGAKGGRWREMERKERRIMSVTSNAS